MKCKIKIKRQKDKNASPYWQEFFYEGDGNISIAVFLRTLDVQWECGCLIQKCGACAMVINGTPCLACSVFINDLKKGQDKEIEKITIEPLGKFPVVQDLVVDRSTIQRSVEEMKLWLEEEGDMAIETHKTRYDSAKCLQCGCCLETCPNFKVGDSFGGVVTAVNAYRILDESSLKIGHGKELKRQYRKHYYAGCGKSLACHDICPIDLPVEEMLIRSNAMAVWGKSKKKARKPFK